MKSACLDWSKVKPAGHEDWLDLYQRLLMIRRREIMPLIPEIRFGACSKLAGRRRFRGRLGAGGRLGVASHRQPRRRAGAAGGTDGGPPDLCNTSQHPRRP